MESTVEIPFRLRGYDGLVTVSYGTTTDPEAAGFDILALPIDLSLTGGFPLMLAEVTYPGLGYRALIGWIQIVTVAERQPQRTWAEVDVYPVHPGLATPFVTFGHAPAVFDAPGPNPPRTDERWTAEPFLAICPDGARSRIVRPVLGFRWGYELVAMRATPLPCTPIGDLAWQRCRTTLMAAFPTWEFWSEFDPEA